MRELPVITQNNITGISCETCIAACCRKSTSMRLSAEDVDIMEAAGTNLKIRSTAIGRFFDKIRYSEPEQRPFYKLLTDCAFLKDNKCTIYDRPDRPMVCGSFMPGSKGCRVIRLLHRVPDNPSLARLGDHLPEVWNVVKSSTD